MDSENFCMQGKTRFSNLKYVNYASIIWTCGLMSLLDWHQKDQDVRAVYVLSAGKFCKMIHVILNAA
jgi:hypothetical protein